MRREDEMSKQGETMSEPESYGLEDRLLPEDNDRCRKCETIFHESDLTKTPHGDKLCTDCVNEN